MIVINGNEFENIQEAEDYIARLKRNEEVAKEKAERQAKYDSLKDEIEESLSVALVTQGERKHLFCVLSNNDSKNMLPLALAEMRLGRRYLLKQNEDGSVSCKEYYSVGRIPKPSAVLKHKIVEWLTSEDFVGEVRVRKVDVGDTTYDTVLFADMRSTEKAQKFKRISNIGATIDDVLNDIVERFFR